MKSFAAIPTILLVVLCNNCLHAQVIPSIEWQRSLGGTSGDMANSIQQTTDSGFIVLGTSYSNDGDVSGNHGGQDYWVVKLDGGGNLVWQKSLGGSDYDNAFYIEQTTDGGYIAAGSSFSNDGDVSGHHGSTLYSDYWVVKLDISGNIAWQQSFGGTSYDDAYFVMQTSDGGFMVAGSSQSVDGDVTGNHGSTDYWIIKLDAGGNLTWEKSLGGSSLEAAISLLETLDGGLIIAGESASNDGDVTGNHGSYDYWIVKLDASDNLEWQKSLGGSEYEFGATIEPISDGGFILAGSSYSNDGDVSGHHGSTLAADYWIVKIDTHGDLIWQKSLGGGNIDDGTSAQQITDGGYIVGGFTHSTNGNVSGNHGDDDYWIVKLDSTGDLVWQKCLGGSSVDQARPLLQTIDDGFIIAGQTLSNDGDVSDNHGALDYWIVKLTCDQLKTFYADADSDGFGNVNSSVDDCYPPVGFVADSTDCDDTSANIYPGAIEIPDNNVDDNCNGIVDEIPTNINNASVDNYFFSISPNPGDGNITLATTFQLEGSVTIKIFDFTGREVDEVKESDVKDIFIRQLHLTHLTAGTYFLLLIYRPHDTNKGQQEMRKLMIIN